MNKFEENKFLQEEIEHKRAELAELERKSKKLGNYYIILSDGLIGEQPINILHWTANVDCYIQGNLFDSKKDAELEVQRRNLIFRFKHFRDECNGDWKPIFGKECKTSKFLIGYSWDSKDEQYKLKSLELGSSNLFHQFGYFKKREDCNKAIELFGEEIQKLFVEGE